ncbi:MAG: methyltransferase, partial [Nitrospirae bacterium]|nr:methyltransferase [Nitrospirota bacterium]
MITRNQLIPCSAGIDKGGIRMDMWKFFNITHREHILCNPMSLEKLEQLIT